MENLRQKLSQLKLETQNDLSIVNDILEVVKVETYPKDYLVPLLHLLENNPTFHFGMPGDIVRAIEKISTQFTDVEYFDLIIQSVERTPTKYNLWLMNRMMNTFDNEDEIKKGLAVFQKVKQESNSNEILEVAQQFIENFDE